LTPRDLVDLMLKTRYAHVGGAAKKNRFTRTDLERHEAKVGAPKLEWLFQTTIDSISLTFAMMGDFALSALDHWARNGAGRPSFMLSSPYPLNELEIELKPLPRIERSTPGWTRTNESDADRMRRYLRRHCFRNISTFLDLLCLSDVDVLAQLRGSCNTSALIAKAGFRPEHYATLGEVANDPDGQRFSSCLCMQTGQKGFLCLTKHGVLRVFEQAIKIIEREIVVLQRLLQEGEPVRLWTNHPRRFKWLA